MTETAGEQPDRSQDHGEVSDTITKTDTEHSHPTTNASGVEVKPQPDSDPSKESSASLNQDATKGADNSPDHSLGTTPTTNNQHPKLSLEQQLSKVKRDLESMVIKYARSESENLQNQAKSREFETKLKRAIKDNESLANRIKILTNDKNQLSGTLSAKVAQLTVLEQKNCSLNNVQNVRLKELETEVEQLRKTNEDLLKSIDTYKSKENELLDFSERLSMKQLLLQAELDKALDNAPDYKKQYDQLVVENGRLSGNVEELTDQLKLTSESLTTERKLVEKLKAEQDELRLKCRRDVEELENEMKVQKRKHQVATKELLKQMKCLQGTLDTMNNTHNGNKLIT